MKFTLGVNAMREIGMNIKLGKEADDVEFEGEIVYEAGNITDEQWKRIDECKDNEELDKMLRQLAEEWFPKLFAEDLPGLSGYERES